MRDAPRIHLEGELAAGARLALDEARAHYLLHVMRLAPGDAVRVFNAAHGEWDAALEPAGRRQAALVPARRLRAPDDAPPGPVLLFAPLKRDATDLVVRMATELGASSLRPVLTARTVATRVNGERLALIAREAAEQSERLDVPAVLPAAALAEVIGGWTAGPIAAAIERGRLGARGWAARPPDALLVGPEGGFSPAELDVLRRCPFIQAVSLGPLVLRAETAVAAGLALLRREREPSSGAAVNLDVHVEPG